MLNIEKPDLQSLMNVKQLKTIFYFRLLFRGVYHKNAKEKKRSSQKGSKVSIKTKTANYVLFRRKKAIITL
jgi:hypothetical protein